MRHPHGGAFDGLKQEGRGALYQSRSTPREVSGKGTNEGQKRTYCVLRSGENELIYVFTDSCRKPLGKSVCEVGNAASRKGRALGGTTHAPSPEAPPRPPNGGAHVQRGPSLRSSLLGPYLSLGCLVHPRALLIMGTCVTPDAHAWPDCPSELRAPDGSQPNMPKCQSPASSQFHPVRPEAFLPVLPPKYP